MSTSFNPPSFARYQRPALIVGVVGFVLLLVGMVFSREQFFHSYIIGFTFWTGIAVGSLALLMLQHLTGGGWGFVIRRVLEAATRTLPLMAVLFIPVILGAHSIYPWMREEVLKEETIVAFKTPFLNLLFFSTRAVLYLSLIHISDPTRLLSI